MVILKHCICTLALVAMGCGTATVDDEADAAPVLDGSGGHCNVFSGTGCFDNERCAIPHGVDGYDGPPGCTAEGSVPAEGSCSYEDGGYDNCIDGYFCTEGKCRPHCGADFCSSGYCTLAGDPIRPGYCTAPCDPLAPACATDSACYLPVYASQESPGCDRTGTGTAGEACTFANDCMPGLTCRSQACGRICTVSTGAECSVGETCAEWTAGAPYGSCIES